MDQTWLYADEHVDRYKEDPVVAGEKIADVWCANPTTSIDVWGCDFPCEAFFESFLDRCREKGVLEEAVEIWWLVHNCPGSADVPCHHDYVVQQVKDYAKLHGIEVKSEWFNQYGVERFGPPQPHWYF